MRYLLALTCCVLTAAGCVNAPLARPVVPAQTPVAPPAAITSTAPALAQAAAEGEVMASVNGKPIYMSQLIEPLIEADGRRIAEMLIADELIAQEAQRESITVTDPDILRENELALVGIFHEQIKPDQRQRLLEQLLQNRGLTKGLWDSTMRRNALLRKLAMPMVKIDDNVLKTEFARVYGEKVQVSHIQLPSLAEAEKMQALLKEGGDFADLARRYSTNSVTAKEGGALAPFTRDNTSVPQAIREAAFALKEGQTSGVICVGETFHIVRVHKRFAPEQVSFDSVKDKLREQVTQRAVETLQLQILTELKKKADVQYIQPELNRQAKAAATRQSGVQ